ncbi:hypothetical protein SDC9_159147 [bioreactor metagenome]|uniref:Uncharacterized protein n=1 Tax=bioreactor metagenome TaxID=1076179 RepID=A0A645FER8_9ZZZZ
MSLKTVVGPDAGEIPIRPSNAVDRVDRKFYNICGAGHVILILFNDAPLQNAALPETQIIAGICDARLSFQVQQGGF